MPRGRTKEIRRPDGEALSLTPPASLVSREARAAYRKIAATLRKSGAAQSVDAEAVALAASSVARLKQLRDEAERTTEVTVMSAKGTVMVHPIFAELRREETRLQSILDRLYLTPKSRQSRTSQAERERMATQANAEVDSDVLRLLG